jgi:hypothetical protein
VRRIQARAIRRCGELLKTFQSAGGRPSNDKKPVTAPSPVSQKAAAEQAGMSERQRVTAVPVALPPKKLTLRPNAVQLSD